MKFSSRIQRGFHPVETQNYIIYNIYKIAVWVRKPNQQKPNQKSTKPNHPKNHLVYLIFVS